MRTLFVLALTMAVNVLADETRAHNPKAKVGVTCNSSADCSLGNICAASNSTCIIGCTGNKDCAAPRICGEMRACSGRADCKKVCHLPDMVNN